MTGPPAPSATRRARYRSRWGSRRGRRAARLLTVILLVAAGVGGYALTDRSGSNPVLQTTASGTLSGNRGYLAMLDAWTHRFYIHTFGDDQLHILDTRTGRALHPPDVIAASNGPYVNPRRPQAFIDDALHMGVRIVDDRSFKGRHTFGVPTSNTFWFLDEATDTFYVIDPVGTIQGVDAHDGRPLPRAAGCPVGPVLSSATVVASLGTGHLFIPCADGTTAMRDSRTLRLLRTLRVPSWSGCPCRRLVDEATGRVFLPGPTALGVLDARTGTLLRTLPIRVWTGGWYDLDPQASGVVALDPRTHNVVAVGEIASRGRVAAPTVLVLDGRSGAVLHQWPVPPHPTAVQVNPLTGHLLVASAGPVDGQGELVGSGTVSVLDMARGSTLHTIGVGILPGQISLDRPARRALVVNFTTNLDHTMLERPPPESAWAGLLRRLKRAVPLLPVAVPPPPQVPSDVTVTVLDLAKL